MLKKQLFTLLLLHYPGTDSVPIPEPDLSAQSPASESASGPDLAATRMNTLLEAAAQNL